MKKTFSVLASLVLAASASAQCDFTVLRASQGPTISGGTVPANRSIQDNAKVAQKSDVQGQSAFFSLGYQGCIVLKSSCAVTNTNGTDPDFIVWETTWGNSYNPAEKARVFASQNGTNWTDLGISFVDNKMDLGSLTWADHFMIIDATDRINGSPDAFDVDGIEFLGSTIATPAAPAPAPNTLASYEGGLQGKKRNGTSNVDAIRSNTTNAYGLPQKTDRVNFYSLGFGGTAIYKFAYAAFNNIVVTETSYGSPACNRYPETVNVEGSIDGINWTVMATNCLDHTLTIPANLQGMNYIKFTDVSDKTKFNSSADGYDVDGAVADVFIPGQTPTGCATAGNAGRFAIENISDENNVPDEIESLQILGETVLFTLQGEGAVLRVTDNMGRVISSQNVEGNMWDVVELALPSAGLATGIYMLTLETPVSVQTVKFVK
jgi:hypothetical protein